MISHADWMRRTAVLARRRSDELVKVDAALKAFGAPGGATPANRSALAAAFEAWKKTGGGDWRKSIRNKDKACEQLDAELRQEATGGRTLTAAEIEAIKHVERANAKNLERLLRGQSLEWKPLSSSKNLGATRTALMNFQAISNGVVAQQTGVTTVGNIKTSLTDLGSSVRAAGPSFSSGGTASSFASSLPKPAGLMSKAREMVEGLLRELFADDLPNVVAKIGGLINEIVTSVANFIGVASSGAKAFAHWVSLATQMVKRNALFDAVSAFAPGDPAAAFAAVIEMLDRKMEQTYRKAATETTAALTQTAFLLVDAGAVSGAILGALKALANLVAQIYLLARDYREMKAANRLLKLGAFNLDLFKVDPLLGCYVVACSDTSAIVNMAVADYGRPGWKFETESMVRRVEPLKIKASQFIHQSSFEIPALSASAGALYYKLDKTLGVPTGKLNRKLDTMKGGFLFKS